MVKSRNKGSDIRVPAFCLRGFFLANVDSGNVAKTHINPLHKTKKTSLEALFELIKFN